MSKVTKFVGLVVILVALLCSVAFLPSTASATSTLWGIGTKTVADAYTNPLSNFPNIWESTAMNPTMLFYYNAFYQSYNWCYLSSTNGFEPTPDFAFRQCNGYWIQFGSGDPTIHVVKFNHFSIPSIQRLEMIMPGWNMVGSPYALSGPPPAGLVNTPMQCFQFSINQTTWKTYLDAISAGWLPYACTYMFDCGTQSYYGLGAMSQLPYGHGMWLRSNIILYMRVMRPPGISAVPSNTTLSAPWSTETSGTPIEGGPGVPY